MPDNSRFVFKPGNQWTDKDNAPYFVIPSAWRRFLFHVLSPRELTVYLYVCSLTDRNAIAYPTTSQIVEDLGVKSRVTVNDALENLKRLGFLLTEAGNRGRLKNRSIYQRPAPQYTLLTLLTLERIDEALFPVGKPRGEGAASTDKAVSVHLQSLLQESYIAYDRAPHEQKRAVLITALEQRLVTMTGTAVESDGSTKTSMSRAEFEALPEPLQKQMAELVTIVEPPFGLVSFRSGSGKSMGAVRAALARAAAEEALKEATRAQHEADAELAAAMAAEAQERQAAELRAAAAQAGADATVSPEARDRIGKRRFRRDG